MTRLPTGSLVVTVGAGQQPYWEGKWRWDGRQHKRRLGKAWLTSGPNGPQDASGQSPHSAWQKRPGRPQEGFLSREDAIVALRSLIAAHAEQEAQERRPEIPSFAQAAEAWYERAQRRGRKPATLMAYRWVIDAHILGQRTFESTVMKQSCPFADKPIDRVSKNDVRAWFDPIEQRPQKFNVLKIVRSICKFAVDEGWARENVARYVDCHSLSYDSYDYFTRDEIERLIAAARDEYDAALYACAAYTGLRKGELFALRWGDIDFEGARVVVRRNYSGRELVTPKNGKVRAVPLVPALAELLMTHKANIPATRPEGETPSTLGVFPGSHDAATDRYAKALKRAGLRHLPFHSLRHSFGSHAVTVATLVQVKTWLGHSDLRMTSRYLHAKDLDTDSVLLARAFT